MFQEPIEQRTDVAETARCRKMRNGKTARLLERRERFERRSLRRGERPEVEKNEVVRDPAQGELPFRAYMETGSLPAFRDTAATVTVQPIQRKKEGYMPMERKPATQTQEPEPQV